MWSGAEPGTTDPLAPFGLVTLAPSGGEGGNDIGTMRWAQTAGYGMTPNRALPNVFTAQAYDLNDPFRNISCYHDTGCPVKPKPAQGWGPSCTPYCTSLAGTNFYMGPIHPRDKKPVGARLAQSAAVLAYGDKGAVTGPTLSGCTLSSDHKTLTLRFNQSLLEMGGDRIDLQPYNRVSGASKMYVLINASRFCMQTSGRGGSSCIDDGTGHVLPGTAPYDDQTSNTTWVNVDIGLGTNNPNEVVVDLRKTGGRVAHGIRYAWTGDCCTENPPSSQGCPLASCPLMASQSRLPANPFMAKIVNGKCKCVPPQ
eukprot:UC1_evm1s612